MLAKNIYVKKKIRKFTQLTEMTMVMEIWGLKVNEDQDRTKYLSKTKTQH